MLREELILVAVKHEMYCCCNQLEMTCYIVYITYMYLDMFIKALSQEFKCKYTKSPYVKTIIEKCLV